MKRYKNKFKEDIDLKKLEKILLEYLWIEDHVSEMNLIDLAYTIRDILSICLNDSDYTSAYRGINDVIKKRDPSQHVSYQETKLYD